MGFYWTDRISYDLSDHTVWFYQSVKHVGPPYKIELLDYKLDWGFNFSCTCPDFLIRKDKKARDGELVPGTFSRCKHCRDIIEPYAQLQLMLEHKRRNP